MNVQDLIGEVAKRHNVLVDPQDPVFVAVTLNELLLAEHVQKVQVALDRAEQMTAHASRQREVQGRVPERELVPQPRRRSEEDRGVPDRLQRGQAAQLAGQPDAEQLCSQSHRTHEASGLESGGRSSPVPNPDPVPAPNADDSGAQTTGTALAGILDHVVQR
jgi:hypothetical protein